MDSPSRFASRKGIRIKDLLPRALFLLKRLPEASEESQTQLGTTVLLGFSSRELTRQPPLRLIPELLELFPESRARAIRTSDHGQCDAIIHRIDALFFPRGHAWINEVPQHVIFGDPRLPEGT